MTTSETREETAMARQPHPVSAGPIVQLPTAFGDFVAQAWTDLATGAEHLAVSSPMAPADGEPRWSASIRSASPAMCSAPTAATAANSWPMPSS